MTQIRLIFSPAIFLFLTSHQCNYYREAFLWTDSAILTNNKVKAKFIKSFCSYFLYAKKKDFKLERISLLC